MYGGDLGAGGGGGGGGGNWKAPDDPSLVVGGKDDVSMFKIPNNLLREDNTTRPYPVIIAQESHQCYILSALPNL